MARQLSGTFLALQRLSPELERFFNGLKPVIKRAEPGFSSLRTILDNQLPPFLGDLEPSFNQLIPILDTVNRYRSEVTAFLGNTSSALNGSSIPAGAGDGDQVPAGDRTARAGGPRLAALAVQDVAPQRLREGGRLHEAAQGLDSFYHRATAQAACRPRSTQGDFSADLYNRTQIYAMGGAGITNTDDVPTPPCTQQGTQSSIGGPPNQNTDYLHVNPASLSPVNDSAVILAAGETFACCPVFIGADDGVANPLAGPTEIGPRSTKHRLQHPGHPQPRGRSGRADQLALTCRRNRRETCAST